MAKGRSIESIRKKLSGGDAVVMTASELCDAVRSGKRFTPDDVDVVTCATKGIMSGTMAVLSFTVAKQNSFLRAKAVRLNGVPAFPGPCPNERLGVLDLTVYGTQHSVSDDRYGGGHLFRDLAEGREITVEVEPVDAPAFSTTVTLKDIPFARLFGTRHAFKNYLAFVNPGTSAVKSIFTVKPLKGSLAEASVCGCGEISPVQKDPKLDVLGVGSPILMNGADGIILGLGTRSSPAKPNLSALADLHDMDPRYMGGFVTSEGPEVICTWAVPIPVLSQKVLDNLMVLDEDTPLSIVDIKGRIPITKSTYADVWQGTSLAIGYDKKGCKGFRSGCPDCPPELLCPTGAFSLEEERIDPERCFNCGTCRVFCRGQIFSGEMGSIDVDGKKVPIVLRQSDRHNAQRLSKELKKRLADGRFELGQPVRKIGLQ